jgi:hypothetical protein
MLIERYRVDPRTGRSRRFPLRHLLRQSVYSRLAGYNAIEDATGGRLTTLPLTGGRVAYGLGLLGE